MLKGFFAKSGVSFMGIWISHWLWPSDILLSTSPFWQLGGVIILTFLLYLIEPVLRKLTFILNFLTLGLFSLGIVIVLLWISSSLLPFVTFQSIKGLLLSGLIIWLFNKAV